MRLTGADRMPSAAVRAGGCLRLRGTRRRGTRFGHRLARCHADRRSPPRRRGPCAQRASRPSGPGRHHRCRAGAPGRTGKRSWCRGVPDARRERPCRSGSPATPALERCTSQRAGGNPAARSPVGRCTPDRALAPVLGLPALQASVDSWCGSIHRARSSTGQPHRRLAVRCGPTQECERSRTHS